MHISMKLDWKGHHAISGSASFKLFASNFCCLNVRLRDHRRNSTKFFHEDSLESWTCDNSSIVFYTFYHASCLGYIVLQLNTMLAERRDPPFTVYAHNDTFVKLHASITPTILPPRPPPLLPPRTIKLLLPQLPINIIMRATKPHPKLPPALHLRLTLRDVALEVLRAGPARVELCEEVHKAE